MSRPALCTSRIATALGPMIAVADEDALYLLEFDERDRLEAELARLARRLGPFAERRTRPMDEAEEQLDAHLSGRRAGFTVPLAPPGTPFQHAVWTALQAIPAGETRSYSQLAAAAGRPAAIRAAGAANGANPIAVLIPCHRALGSDGRLTGYGGGLWRKERLIEIETSYRSPS